MKQYDQAIATFEVALKIRKELYGDDTVGVAITLDNLGLAHARKKAYPKSEEVIRQSLKIFEKRDGALGSHTITATRNLAAIYEEQDKTDEAVNLLQKLFDLMATQWGKDSPKLLGPIDQLRSLYVKKGDSKSIEAIFRRSLDLLEKNAVAAYPQKVYVLSILGFEMAKQKKNAEAEDFLKRAVDGTDVQGAKKAPDAANIAISFYVKFLKDNGRDKEALAVEDKARKMFSDYP